MSNKRGDTYKSLRKVVTELGKLQGETDTGDLIYGLDRLWRSLLKTRKIIVDTLKEQNQIKDASSVPVFDFYNLYCQIYQPRTKDTTLCNNCFSRVDTILTECPFCKSQVRCKKSEAQIDFNIVDAAPKWDINVDPSELLVEVDPMDEMIQPITQRDDIIGPKGSTNQTRSKKMKKVSTSTRKMIVWMRKREFGKVIPFSLEQLGELSFYDLRTVATLMPHYDPEVVSRYDSSELITYILGAQGDKPLDPGPPPYGEIPELGELQ